MFEQRKLAVLIDSDNVSAKYAQFIMQEVEKYGVPTYKRVYGDWEKGGNGWHNAAINYSIMPVQQSCYITGKNATDFSMIIDAMDILYTGKVDGFCLVTSDSDFTRLAIRLREAGMLVVGIGELKTPRAFTISCHHFCYLNQVCEPDSTQDEQSIRKAVLEYMADNQSERIDLAKINAVLTSRFGNINFNELGYKRFSSFIDSFEELRRNNTFVSVRKKKAEVSVPEIKAEDLTEADVVKAIRQYFEEYAPQNDNMMKIESYLTAKFGKIDFSKFGSKRFARFIDKQSEFKRTGTFIEPAAKQDAPELTVAVFAAEAEEYAKANSPKGGNAGQLNNYLIGKFGKDYFRAIGFSDFSAALDSVGTVVVDNNKVYLVSDKPQTEREVISTEKITEIVKAYAEANAPQGGNVGQLNNELMEKFGKTYCADLGFADYRSLLSAMSGVYVKKNRVFPAIVEDSQPEEEQPSEPVKDEVVEVITAEVPQKPDMNTIKRDVLNFVANAEKGGALSSLGKVLSEKYGKSFLKEMGYTSMRKLAAEVNGVVIRSNKLYIDEAFAKQTEEIEQFVIDFANSDGKRSVRALGIQLRQRFDGFDFKNYGFDRFTDFVNAIDGVKADRYHINPTKSEE